MSVVEDDPITYLNDNWNESLCDKGVISYIQNCDLRFVQYGVIIDPQRNTYTPDSIQIEFGRDLWKIYLVGPTAEMIDDLATHIIYLCDNITPVNSTRYARFVLDYDNGQYLTEYKNKVCNYTWRVLTTTIQGWRLPHDAHRNFDGIHSTNLGVP